MTRQFSFVVLTVAIGLAPCAPYLASASPLPRLGPALLSAPQITFPPQPRSAVLGGRAVFTVIASGDLPMTYRWRKDGVELHDGGGTSGATTDALTLTQLVAADAGAYSVVVSNGQGDATSADVDLTVGIPRGGDVDASFASSSAINDDVHALALQPDGKALVGGRFTMMHGAPRKWIGRVGIDGATDAAFASHRPGGPDSVVDAIAIQPDGNVLAGGKWDVTNGIYRSRIDRLRPDGSADPAFQPATTLGNSGAGGFAIALQADGRILVGGVFYGIGGIARNHIARLEADGNVDASFLAGMSGPDNAVSAFLIQPDGRILVGGSFSTFNGAERPRLVRLNADGSVDASFQPQIDAQASFSVTSLVRQPDGKLLVEGWAFVIAGVTRNGVARLNADGTLDAGFMNGMSGTNDGVMAMALQPDGRVVLAGRFSTVNGVPRGRVARLNADGSLDAGFASGTVGADASVESVALQPDGKVILAGDFHSVDGMPRRHLARLSSAGTLDPGFVNGDGAEPRFGETLNSIVTLPDLRVLIGGSVSTLGNLTRLLPDGMRDTTFPIVGSGVGGTVTSILLQPDGKLVIGGNFTTVGPLSRRWVARLNADGSVDPSFQNVLLGIGAPGYIVHAMVLQPDGKIVIAGKFSLISGSWRSGFARLHANGSVDTTFAPQSGPGGSGYIAGACMALQPDGKILVGTPFGIQRATADGIPDPTFQASSGAVLAIAVQPDGHVLIGGDFTTIQGTSRNGIARLLTDGVLDASFQSGMSGASGVSSIALQPDGKIVIGGSFLAVNGVSRGRIARLNPDGSLDPTFQDEMSGADDVVRALALLPDGRILAAGSVREVNGEFTFPIARLYGDAPVAPAITEQPADQVSYDGCCAMFRATATGSPRDYVWRKDGVDLADGPGVSGSRSSTLHLSGVSSDDAAAYSVAVTNVLGGATSADAQLEVEPVPACSMATCDTVLGCTLSLSPDSDGDSFPNTCDNCASVSNETQSDRDHDATGDACDLDDGEIWEWRASKTSIDWQVEQGPTSWNVYVGDLSVLVGTGVFTQAPGSNPLAARVCAVAGTSATDAVIPDSGRASFSLISGVSGGVESSLGSATSGPRANANPCP